MIIKERLINKSSNFLYKKWTTKDGLNSFFSKENDIEIKPFGKYEIYFTGDKNIINRGSEGCVVISCLLDKVLSFTWNTPPNVYEVKE